MIQRFVALSKRTVSSEPFAGIGEYEADSAVLLGAL